MYSTCIFCRAPLGANDLVERFPVGVRVAFDAERGRLWAVCPRCRRWNLAPLEERWEAVEDCERLFPRTGLQVSTENVGLARLADGTELVRIGKPVRAEVASWRWGGQFLQRARSAHVVRRVGGALGVAGMIATGGWLFGMMYGNFVGKKLVAGAVGLYLRHLSTTRILTPDGERMVLRGRHVEDAEMVSLDVDGAARWALRVPHTRGEAVLEGYPALLASRYVLARLNREGGEEPLVKAAVGRFEASGSPAALFDVVARGLDRVRARTGLDGVALRHLPPEVLLSVEMAASEESERRAMEGELATLQREWREAEEVASIADSLLVPARVAERLRGARSATERDAGGPA